MTTSQPGPRRPVRRTPRQPAPAQPVTPVRRARTATQNATPTPTPNPGGKKNLMIVAGVLLAIFLCVGLFFGASLIAGYARDASQKAAAAQEVQLQNEGAAAAAAAQAATPVPVVAEVAPEVKSFSVMEGGTGDIIIENWREVTQTTQIVTATVDTVLYVSSDPGSVELYRKDGKDPVYKFDSGKYGFEIAISMKAGDSLHITNVGWNEANAHRNTWAEFYELTGYESLDAALSDILVARHLQEKKPYSLTVDTANAVEYYSKPAGQ